jgi:hypothetical protein
MFRAMAVKELRETMGVALLGLGAYALSSQWSGGADRPTIPFVEDSVSGIIIFLSAVVAIALGLRQTLGEAVGGTYPLLLHRPATRRWLIGMKLLVGMIVYLMVGAIPILVYGLWAAAPGTHASPFQWSMTVPAWAAWFGMTVLYLTAFLSGIRPGRWYRSRLLPLAAGILAVALGAALGADHAVRLAWAMFIAAGVDIGLIALILFVVETRDYP